VTGGWQLSTHVRLGKFKGLTPLACPRAPGKDKGLKPLAALPPEDKGLQRLALPRAEYRIPLNIRPKGPIRHTQWRGTQAATVDSRPGMRLASAHVHVILRAFVR